tara:strand:- start:1158 stop:1691 length:534 start_codon:yes stop_codon:yes gene_type:complete
MIYKLVIFIISLTFFFSCKRHNNAESVDNLVEQLSIQKNKLSMVEVETIDAAFKAFQYNVGNLNRCVDSFSLELGNALNYYKGIKKIKPIDFKTKHDALHKKINNQINQIELLSHDISLGLIPKDSIPIYATMEKQNVDAVTLEILTHYSDYMYVKQANDSLDSYFKTIIKRACEGV